MNTIPIRQGQITRPVTLRLPGRYVNPSPCDHIDRAVAEEFGIRPDQLFVRDRRERVAYARFLTMKLHHAEKWSVVEIGRRYQRHHADVIYALKRLAEIEPQNPWFRQHAEAVRRRL